MSLNGTGNGKKGAQQKVHRGHRECEVTDEIFASTGPRLDRDVRWFRRGFTPFTNHESLARNSAPAGILGLHNYGGAGNETLVVTAGNKDCEDH